MNSEKLKSAFGKIREDIQALNFKLKNQEKNLNDDFKKFEKKIENLEKAGQLSSNIKDQIDELKKIDIESYIEQLKKNYEFIKNINEDFNQRLENFYLQFNDLKDKISNYSSLASSNNQQIDEILSRMEIMEELIDKKIKIETQNIKEEILNQIREEFNSKSTSKKTTSKTATKKVTKKSKDKTLTDN